MENRQCIQPGVQTNSLQTLRPNPMTHTIRLATLISSSIAGDQERNLSITQGSLQIIDPDS